MAEEFFGEESFRGDEGYDQKNQDYFAEEYFIAPSEETGSEKETEFSDTLIHKAAFYGTLSHKSMGFSKKDGYKDTTKYENISLDSQRTEGKLPITGELYARY